MAYKMNYRVDITNAAAGINIGSTLVAVNSGYTKQIGLNQAVSSGLSFVRRFQAVGIDAEAVVSGKPVGTAVVGASYDLEGDTDAMTERQYAHLDAPGRGLLQKISAANTVPAGTDDFDTDEAPDLGLAATA